MADLEQPFLDVRTTADGFSIPELKWRELLFVGAVRRDGDLYVRDPARPLPPFRPPDLFPDGARLRLVRREDGRVVLRRLDGL
jgi:hypothetical protein